MKGGANLNNERNEWETGQEAAENKQSTLPKPLRTFSYFFFGIVIVGGLLGWFVSSGR